VAAIRCLKVDTRTFFSPQSFSVIEGSMQVMIAPPTHLPLLLDCAFFASFSSSFF
jgi:hypothetical protein